MLGFIVFLSGFFKNSIAAQQITADVTSHLCLILQWLLAKSFHSLRYGSQISHRKQANTKIRPLKLRCITTATLH